VYVPGILAPAKNLSPASAEGKDSTVASIPFECCRDQTIEEPSLMVAIVADRTMMAHKQTPFRGAMRSFEMRRLENAKRELEERRRTTDP
jgi:hypothetical protein